MEHGHGDGAGRRPRGIACHSRRRLAQLGVVDNLAGAAAAYGIAHANGIKIAVDEINEAGGIKGLGKIEVIVEDDGSKPTEAVNATRGSSPGTRSIS